MLIQYKVDLLTEMLNWLMQIHKQIIMDPLLHIDGLLFG